MSIANEETKQKMKVGIFGSCRQHPIAKHFNVLNIHEELSYPHYSKEVIECIRYCKNESEMTDAEAALCFRSGILYKKSLQKDKIRKQFQECDIFVVEIASRKTQEYKKHFAHHIVTEDQYHSPIQKEVSSRIQSDIEIEEDLHTIRKLFYPKPFVLVTHIQSQKEGERFKLIQLLQDIAKKMRIPCISPSDELSSYTSHQLQMPEEKLAHYTEFGKTQIGQIYKKFCEDTYFHDHEITQMTQIQYTDEERVANHTIQGFGDYTRGCLWLYRYCKANKIYLRVSFNNHTLSKYLYSTTERSLEECKNTIYCFQQGMESQPLPCNIFTNKVTNLDKLTSDEKQFLIEHCLTPRIEFDRYFDHVIQSHHLVKKKYTVIHVRTGDSVLVEKKSSSMDSVAKKILDQCKKKNITDYIVLSDSKDLQSKFLNQIQTEKAHLGHYEQDDTSVRDTLVDFFLMRWALQIHQFSVYSWPSGFSKLASSVFDVPLVVNKL